MYIEGVENNIHKLLIILICSFLIFSLSLSNFLNVVISTQAAERITYVNSNATGANDGSTWQDAFTELQSALEEASEGNEIWIAEGTYYPTKDIKGNVSPSDARTKSFQMKNGVSIFGGFPANDVEATFESRDAKKYKTVISGDLNKNNAIDDSDTYHVFYHPQGTFINGTALLDGVIISGGNANNYSVIDALNGGGMFNNRSHPKLNEVIIAKNHAESNGGGIYNENSDMHFENGVINGNSSNTGAGFYNTNGNPVLSNVVISENVSKYRGGGIYSQSGKLTISKGTIAENVSGSFGGGLSLNGDGQLNDFKLLNNKARSGAGIYIQGNSVVMKNGEISGNTTAPTDSGSGGGIYSSSGWNNTFNNIDVHSNEAHSGGGIYSEGGSSVYTNTCISNNKASNGGGISIMSGTPKFIESEISNNIAVENGGGVLNNTAQPIFTNTVITSNLAKNGAGIYSSEGSITSLNSRFQGNEAISNGGALYNYNSNLLFTNTLVSGNKAINGGGFYENYADASKFINVTVAGNSASKGGAFYNSASNPTLQNSIIWGNGDGIHNSGSTPSFAYSLIQGSGGSDSWNNTFGKNKGENLDMNPNFVEFKAPSSAPTTEGNYRLASDSIAIDKGSNELVSEGITEDIDGDYRKMGLAVDLGVYEKFTPDTEKPIWPVNSRIYVYPQDMNSMQLEWVLAKDNYQVEGYRIYVDDKFIHDVKQPASVDGYPVPSLLNYKVTDLQPNTTYKFVIEAYDKAGNISKKQVTEGRTSREPDAEAPSWEENANLIISEKVSSGIEVVWPIATDNQGVPYYRVSVDGVDQGTYDSNMKKAILRNLEPNTEYEISVNAIDYQGNLSNTLSENFKTLPIWQEGEELQISEKDNNAPILIVPMTKSGLVSRFEILVDGETVNYSQGPNNSYYLMSLIPDKEHDISVKTFLYNGDKFEMKSLNYKTLPIWEPEAKLEFSQIQQSSVLLTFPEIKSGLVWDMEILVDGQRWNYVSRDQHTEYIYNLASDTEYEVSLKVYDGTGEMLKELKDKVKTAPYSDQEPPSWNYNQELKATEIKETSMKLLWPKATDNEGIKGYRIFVDNEEIANVDSSKTEYVIDGLIKGTTYILMVQAYDEKENVAFIRLGVQTASSSGGGGNGGGQVIVLPPAPPVPQEPVTPPVIVAPPPAPSEPESPETPEEPTKPNTQLVDIEGHWAEKQIIEGVQKKMINGYLDNTFKPDNQINRAEFTILLANALGLTGDGEELDFSDNSKIGPSARAAIKRALEAGLIHGFEDGSFRPTQKITRMEMAAMIARAMKLEGDAKANTSFSDDGSIPAWARGAIAAMKETGVISGRGNNKFEPTVNATRAETVVMLLRMMKYEK